MVYHVLTILIVFNYFWWYLEHGTTWKSQHFEIILKTIRIDCLFSWLQTSFHIFQLDPLPGRVAILANLLQIVFKGTVTQPHTEFKFFLHIALSDLSLKSVQPKKARYSMFTRNATVHKSFDISDMYTCRTCHTIFTFYTYFYLWYSVILHYKW